MTETDISKYAIRLVIFRSDLINIYRRLTNKKKY